jgi:uncharacterized protein (DUF1501 family)
MRGDWWSCDGTGGEHLNARPFDPGGSSSALTMTRRGVLLTAGLASVGWLSQRSALAQVAIQPGSAGAKRDVLVSVFLRGGADGLSIVVPYTEDAYHRARPSLGLAAPTDKSTNERVLDLDGFFGLNPALGALLPLFQSGRLGIVHACGSDDHSRSHFEAMSAMERGLPDASGGAASGWISRHLAVTEPERPSPLRAVAFSATMPDSLRGATGAVAMEALEQFRLAVSPQEAAEWNDALTTLYGNGKDAMAEAGRETLQVLESLRKLDVAAYKPSAAANYPKSELGDALKQVAVLVKADLGLEVACVDKGGWDTHVAQGALTGWLAGLLKDLGDSLAAFATDLGSEMGRVTVVVQTEFGRRVAENTGLGTDHGRASVMMLLGGGTIGGKVYGKWPGLEPPQLEEPGDLKVTTDYRDVLTNILTARVLGSDAAKVFPGHRAAQQGFVRPLA